MAQMKNISNVIRLILILQIYCSYLSAAESSHSDAPPLRIQPKLLQTMESEGYPIFLNSATLPLRLLLFSRDHSYTLYSSSATQFTRTDHASLPLPESLDSGCPSQTLFHSSDLFLIGWGGGSNFGCVVFGKDQKAVDFQLKLLHSRYNYQYELRYQVDSYNPTLLTMRFQTPPPPSPYDSSRYLRLGFSDIYVDLSFLPDSQKKRAREVLSVYPIKSHLGADNKLITLGEQHPEIRERYVESFTRVPNSNTCFFSFCLVSKDGSRSRWLYSTTFTPEDGFGRFHLLGTGGWSGSAGVFQNRTFVIYLAPPDTISSANVNTSNFQVGKPTIAVADDGLGHYKSVPINHLASNCYLVSTLPRIQKVGVTLLTAHLENGTCSLYQTDVDPDSGELLSAPELLWKSQREWIRCINSAPADDNSVLALHLISCEYADLGRGIDLLSSNPEKDLSLDNPSDRLSRAQPITRSEHTQIMLIPSGDHATPSIPQEPLIHPGIAPTPDSHAPRTSAPEHEQPRINEDVQSNSVGSFTNFILIGIIAILLFLLIRKSMPIKSVDHK